MPTKSKQITTKQKHLLSLYRQLRESWDDTDSEENWVLLPEPVQRGWVKTFVLRDDVQRRNDAALLLQILSWINSTAACRTRKFRTKITKGIYKAIPLELQKLTERKYLDLLAEYEGTQLGGHLRRYFTKRVTKHTATVWHAESETVHYIFMHAWMFATAIAPCWVTHNKRLNGAFFAHQAEIERQFDAAGGWSALYKITHGTRRDNDPDWYYAAKIARNRRQCPDLYTRYDRGHVKCFATAAAMGY
jgi:hypothetical protein